MEGFSSKEVLFFPPGARKAQNVSVFDGELFNNGLTGREEAVAFLCYPNLPVIYSSVFSCVGEVKTSSVVPNSNSSPRSMNPV